MQIKKGENDVEFKFLKQNEKNNNFYFCKSVPLEVPTISVNIFFVLSLSFSES